MKLTVISPPATFWDSFSDTAFPALLQYGYTLFKQIADPTIFKRVIYANGVPQSDSEVGYTLEAEIPPNAGFSNTGNTIDLANGDVGIITLLNFYGIPLKPTYAQLLAIDFSVIPEEDVRVTLKDGIFTDWATQPYTPLLDVDGNKILDVDNNVIYAIKDF